MPVLKTEITRKTEIFFLVVSLIFLALNCNYSFNIYDEGVAMTGAMRVLNGEIPYRDFWTMYAPGQYYFLAAIFKIFGQSLIIERIISVLSLWGIAVFAWLSAKEIFSKNTALAILLLETLWIGSYRFFASPLATALLLAMISVYCTILFLKNRNRKDIFIAGIFAGLTTLFRHDLGAYTVLALSAAIFAHNIHRFKSDIFKEIFKNFFFFLLGICIIVIPVAAFFLANVPFKTLTNQLVTFPATTFAEYRELPFPSFTALFKSGSLKQIVKSGIELCMFYLPISALAILLIMFLKRVFRKNPDLAVPRFKEIAVLWTAGVMFMIQISVRADSPHLLSAMVPSIMVAVFVFKNSWFLPRFKNIIRISVVLLGIVVFAGAGIEKVKVNYNQFLKPTFALKTEKGKGISGDEFLKDYNKLLYFLKENSSENEKIFIGNLRHDMIVNNDAMLYFLSDRLPATRYHELHPGAATSEAVQREIVDELLKNNVQLVVLRNEVLTVIEPNKSSVSSGVFVLDNFFKNNFLKVAEFGDYQVLKRAEK